MPKPSVTVPRWVTFASATGLTLLILLTINFRAFREYSRERAENHDLSEMIEDLTDENLALQEETLYLKTDPKKITVEARKLGFKPQQEKFAEPAK